VNTQAAGERILWVTNTTAGTHRCAVELLADVDTLDGLDRHHPAAAGAATASEGRRR
jgi:hypothetical protein